MNNYPPGMHESDIPANSAEEEYGDSVLELLSKECWNDIDGNSHLEEMMHSEISDCFGVTNVAHCAWSIETKWQRWKEIQEEED